jgi:monothiol glutaredoxin
VSSGCKGYARRGCSASPKSQGQMFVSALRRGLLQRRSFGQVRSGGADYADKFKLIKETIEGNKVVVFMKGTPEAPRCGYSRTVCQVLGQFPELPRFTAVDVLADEQLREAIKEFSKWPTIPQLYVAGEFIGGCDIVYGMYRDGSLSKLLEDSKVFEHGKQ